MIEMYGQILLTYVRRPLFWLATALFLLFLLITLGANETAEWRKLDLVFLIVPTSFFGFCLTTQVKEQLADPRTLLLPAGRMPFLLVAAAMMGTLFSCWALLVARGACYPVAGPLAFCLVNFTLLVLTSFIYSFLLALLFLVFFLGALFAAINPDLRAHCDLIVTGESMLLVWSLIVGSAAVLVSMGAWLSKRRMENNGSAFGTDGGIRKFSLRTRQCPDHERRQPGMGASGLLQQASARKFDMLKGRVGSGLWQRARLRRLNHGAFSFWVAAAPMVVLFLIFPLVQRLDDETPNLMMDSFLVYFIPYIFLMSMIQNIWPRLGVDLLRPAARNRMVLEQGLALLIDLFLVWVILLASMTASVLVWMPRYVTWQGVLLLLVSSASVQILTFGIVTFAGTFRSFVVLLLFIFPLAIVSKILWEGCEDAVEAAATGLTASQFGDDLAKGLIYSSVVLVAGLAVTLFSYRRWCRIDLD